MTMQMNQAVDMTQERKQDILDKTKKTKVSYQHMCLYLTVSAHALICNKHLFHKHVHFAFLQM